MPAIPAKQPESAPLELGRPPETDNRPGRLGVGSLIPLALMAWFLLDLTLRFLPLDWLRLRNYQTAMRLPGRYSPFGPNLQIPTDDWVGELPVMANLEPTETRPPLRFTTDALGFRATPGISGRPPRVLLVDGDSFTFGAALSDDETLAAALTRKLGISVYNGGRNYTDPEGLAETGWLLEKLAHSPRTILYIHLEITDHHLDPMGHLGRADRYRQRLLRAAGTFALGERRYEDALSWMRRLEGWNLISPLEILAVRADKAMSDGRLLPNWRGDAVDVYRLPDGRRFLVERRFGTRALNPPGDAAVLENVEYLTWFHGEMKRCGIEVWFLLLPEGITLYAPWLVGKPAGGETYLHRMERVLRGRGMEVINALAEMRKTAAEDLAQGKLYYYREDHHWNPEGVELVAEAVARALRDNVKP
ncbi:MAG: hypothetical protein WD696_23260 [Bryobacteraceae bacterium]